MNLNSDKVAEGLKMHFIDVFLDELTKVGHDEVRYIMKKFFFFLFNKEVQLVVHAIVIAYTALF